MIHASAKTLQQFKLDYDEYGDSYTLDITEEQLQDIFNTMQKVCLCCIQTYVVCSLISRFSHLFLYFQIHNEIENYIPQIKIVKSYSNMNYSGMLKIYNILIQLYYKSSASLSVYICNFSLGQVIVLQLLKENKLMDLGREDYNIQPLVIFLYPPHQTGSW